MIVGPRPRASLGQTVLVCRGHAGRDWTRGTDRPEAPGAACLGPDVASADRARRRAGTLVDRVCIEDLANLLREDTGREGLWKVGDGRSDQAVPYGNIVRVAGHVEHLRLRTHSS